MTTLDDLERLHAAATTGPWRAGSDYIAFGPESPVQILFATGYGGDQWHTTVDLECIAATRNALPAMLRALRAGVKMRDAIARDIAHEVCTTPEMVPCPWLREHALVDEFDAALAALEAKP